MSKKNLSPKFYNADGSLTAYSLACGNVQRRHVADRYVVSLIHDGCYHIKVSDRKLDLGMAAWETADRLGLARKLFRGAVNYYATQSDAPAIERDNSPNAKAPWL